MWFLPENPRLNGWPGVTLYLLRLGTRMQWLDESGLCTLRLCCSVASFGGLLYSPHTQCKQSGFGVAIPRLAVEPLELRHKVNVEPLQTLV